MYKTNVEHKFKVNDEVKHRTNGSTVGLITDFRYYAYHKVVEYQVAFLAIGGTAWFYADELILKDKHGKNKKN